MAPQFFCRECGGLTVYDQAGEVVADSCTCYPAETVRAEAAAAIRGLLYTPLGTAARTEADRLGRAWLAAYDR